ncbi:MAG: phenylalanine--tRNA ligase subunit alpha, partial [Erysipelothrix sp.]|nr:phenylalanine--tRNA ligase subunit alpha [Erysipelothrix sp.]
MDLIQITQEGLEAIKVAETLDALENVRIAYLSKKGSLTQAMSKMKDLPNEEKPLFGKLVNESKQALETALQEKQTLLKEIKLNEDMKNDAID